MPEEIDTATQKLSGKPLLLKEVSTLRTSPSETAVVPLEVSPPPAPPEVTPRAAETKSANKGRTSKISALENQCRQLVLSLYFRETAPVRSIGFTSSIDGEGKSFLSAVTAKAISEVSPIPVTLLECNWQHATLHEYY